MPLNNLKVVGLNCGTSVDGIDLAVVSIEIEKLDTENKIVDLAVKLLHYFEIPMEHAAKRRILNACVPGTPISTAELCDMNFAIGEIFGNATLNSGFDIKNVDLIASHGQTIWHEPRGAIRNSTLQLGEPAVIANISGKTVISGFRSAEVAVGRQGAPICGFLESAILLNHELVRVSQNIGGIGNVTVVDPKLQFFQFDTGPGNMLIDSAVRILTGEAQQFDIDGKIGELGEGQIDLAFVEDFLKNEYFSLMPPKTTGRELFGDNVSAKVVKSLQDKGLSQEAIVATMTRITSESIARAYESLVIPQISSKKIDEIYLCGGGAHNPNILKHLRNRFPHTTVQKIDKIAPISADAKEAVAFAVLGYLTLNNIRLPIPRFSESDTKVTLGNITPGENFGSLMAKLELADVPLTLGNIKISTN